MLNVLLVEDNKVFRQEIGLLLGEKVKLFEASNKKRALSLINRRDFDVVIIDLTLEEPYDGIEILKASKKKGMYSIVLSNYDDDEVIEKAYEVPCDRYLTKDDFSEIIYDLIIQRECIEKGILTNFFRNKFITQNTKLIEDISSVISKTLNKRPLLIHGATGTGKTLLARLVHDFYSKKESEFIDVNIAAIPDTLIESEVFGHVKGAFSGAVRGKKGLLARANDGTLFLDEIGSISQSMQVKLLKAIEEKRFYPLGSEEPKTSNFRLISSTCENIYEMIKKRSYRVDFFHRINEISIFIPPISERKEDISLLIKYFLGKSSLKCVIDNSAMDSLKNYSWPGNTRELFSVLSQLINSGRGVIKKDSLPEQIRHNCSFLEESKDSNFRENIYKYMMRYGYESFSEYILKDTIRNLLEENMWDHAFVYNKLKISHATYYRYLKKFDIKKEQI